MVIRRTAFQKSVERVISSSLIRFISLILISFLGAMIYAGLAAISPDMKQTGNEYYRDQNVMDIQMLSTYGFTQEDVNAIQKTEGVSGVLATYSVDAAGSMGNKDHIFRVNGLPETPNKSSPDYINQLILVEGRMPQKNGEAVILRPAIGLKNIALGDTVTLDKNSNKSIPDMLNNLDYTIVGIAESPYYLFFMQGNTSIGNGLIEYVLYVPPANFIVDGFTNVFVTVEGAKQYQTFDGSYFDYVAVTESRLKKLAEERQTLRHDKFVADLEKGKEDYADGEKELSDAQTKLDDAAKKLEDGKKKYADGLAEYKQQKADAEEKFYDAKLQLDAAAGKLTAGRRTLKAKQKEFDAAEAQLKAARKQLDDGWAQYNQNVAQLAATKAALAQNKIALDAAQAQYDAAATAAESTTGMTMDQIEASLLSMKSQVESLESQYGALSQLAALKTARDAATAGSPEYDDLDNQYQAALNAAGLSESQADTQIGQLGVLKSQLDAAQQQYDQLSALVSTKNTLIQQWAAYNAAVAQVAQGEAALASARQALESGEADYAKNLQALESGKEQLSIAWQELEDGEKSYDDGLNEYTTQKANADIQFANAKAKLDDALVEITDGEKELKEKQQEFDDKKVDAAAKLADAKKEIDDADKKIADLGEPKWYVLDRNYDESFVNYKSNADRMRDLATVFPFVFFLVAALVCLTTMTRMVDEDRTIIGTFKALGYSNATIASRYLLYAASASLIGSILGVSLGFWLLPTIVWNAYQIIFILPDLAPGYFLNIGIISVLMTVLITTVSTGIAIRNSLQESPSDLMRPKAPKKGKRVFLEYIKPIWNGLSFTQKVTVRNLGLNMKRLSMILIGIIGCTALVVTALGAQNAVSSIISDQFGKIFHYNSMIGFSHGAPSSDLSALLSDSTYFQRSEVALRAAAEASVEGKDKDKLTVYVVSPEDANSFTRFTSLIDPNTGKEISMSDDSVVVTQKLSEVLKVGVGDKILVKYLDKDNKYPVVITGITQNYAMNFVYIGKSVYEKDFGASPEYNQIYAQTAPDKTNDEIRKYLSTASGIEAVSFMDDFTSNMDKSLQSVNVIIWVLVISAGLLTFVVIYNLTNINIGERQRELATLKVLGFFDGETYGYIFRETIILSIMGCIIGLFVGIFLYRAVIATVEPDMVLLSRDLGWQGYLLSASLIMLFTWIANQALKPRIKHIDMLESLKSVD